MGNSDWDWPWELEKQLPTRVTPPGPRSLRGLRCLVKLNDGFTVFTTSEPWRQVKKEAFAHLSVGWQQPCGHFSLPAAPPGEGTWNGRKKLWAVCLSILSVLPPSWGRTKLESSTHWAPCRRKPEGTWEPRHPWVRGSLGMAAQTRSGQQPHFQTPASYLSASGFWIKINQTKELEPSDVR